ncbi:hypothetical protein WISP_114824 [Willisornis vidua]|uniref:tRNA-uridine aminocarboxypropyltransferase 1 n=1 Tax=Willisornis vidua TaxID=1566151 RepID=A0ABQ9CXE4_9PASS|nr:hypothetical protein WISP_114824 [Willisornis vidua]
MEYLGIQLLSTATTCNDMTPEQMATNVNCSSPERHTRSYDYMEGGDVRVRRLFCRTQWYMRIDKRGKVKGTREANNNYSILEIRTVAVGIVAIKGVESEYFLAMNKSGRLYGKKVCNEDCNFIELIEENHYNTYASAKWTHKGKEMFVTLNHKGVPMKGLAEMPEFFSVTRHKDEYTALLPTYIGWQTKMTACSNHTMAISKGTMQKSSQSLPHILLIELLAWAELWQLPLKIDIIKHPNEIDGKSTAVHAKLLAPDDVTIYKYPCIPEYEEERHEIALIFPGPNSVSVKDLAFHLQKHSPKGVCNSDDDCSKEPVLKQAKIEPKEEKPPDECISGSRNEGTRLKRILFIDSTWNQTKKIITDERLQGLLQIELKTRKTCFWRHQKGKPDTYLSTIEAIYYFLVDYHQEILKENYQGQYDNLLFFFSFMYTLIKNAKRCAEKE